MSFAFCDILVDNRQNSNDNWNSVFGGINAAKKKIEIRMKIIEYFKIDNLVRNPTPIFIL